MHPSTARPAAVLAAFLASLPLAAAGVGIPSEPLDSADQAATLALQAPSALVAGACPAAAPVRSYAVTALPVPVSYNHWGDHDPLGQLFVLDADRVPLLQDVSAKLLAAGMTALANATQALAAAIEGGDPAAAAAQLVAAAQKAISTATSNPRAARDGFVADTVGGFGQRFDVSPLARPLVVRARPGECVHLHLLNLLPQAASLHVHGTVERPGQAMALGGDLPDLAAPGASRDYRLFVPDHPAMEGAHAIESHGDVRYQTKHGLFGALVVEPAGTAWTGPGGAGEAAGPEAIVHGPGADFREYVVLYHDEVELFDRFGRSLPILSPPGLGGGYGPGSKGINLRSEPFMDRFTHAEALHAAGELDRGLDKSLAYSSYAYGDPATPVFRAYVGDPVKFRLLNAGPSQHHVHHLHGGGDRWRASPLADDTQFDDGLVKDNPIVASTSERIDVQTIGPGESFSAEVEGGAGGVQQSVGDFLVHCHIVEHYMAGMWAVWRVHNTRQPGLAELPDRIHGTPHSVHSRGLVGKTMPDGTVLTAANVGAWVEAQLPPQGVPGSNDAAVWDWTVHTNPVGPLYLGEPEDAKAWPNHASAHPGERRPLRFNPEDGRLAYPFLTPHLGKRPPFSPGHGPAPYLGPDASPGRPDGLCPADARPVSYDIVAMPTVVKFNALDDDTTAQIFALAEDRAAIAAGTKPATSLLIRANQGDCIDVLLANALTSNPDAPSKVNIHTHLVQFDVQGSDGVVTGFNHEQSVRPAASGATTLADPAPANATAVTVADAAALRPGTWMAFGLGFPGAEVRRIVSASGAVATLDAPLGHAHAAGALVSPEFVRYRWFADVELGTVYWHDHVDGINSWRHGLFGTLVVEPAESQWCRPDRPANASDDCAAHTLREGAVADIVSADPDKRTDPRFTFRELALQYLDRACSTPSFSGDCLNHANPTAPTFVGEPAAFNLRADPLWKRNAVARMDSDALAPPTAGLPPGAAQGDPHTPMLLANPGDATVVRLVYAGASMTRAVATFEVSGHRFRTEQHLEGSTVSSLTSLGISDQRNLRLECGAGTCRGLTGDFLYRMTQADDVYRGAWGVLRVVDSDEPGGPTPLPSTAGPPTPPVLGPVRHYDVVAMRATVSTNGGQALSAPLSIFALASDEAAIAAGTLRPEPLVLRALPGETLEISLTNRLPVSTTMHATGLEPLSIASQGPPVGRSDGTLVAPSGTQVLRWSVPADVDVAHLSGLPYDTAGSMVDQAMQGLYGAVVVEPEGSTFSSATGAQAVVTLPGGTVANEAVLLLSNTDANFHASIMGYTHNVQGATLANYRTEPLAGRVGTLGLHTCERDTIQCEVGTQRFEARSPAIAAAFLGLAPETPIVEAVQGQPLLLRLVNAAGSQLRTPGLAGHAWAAQPALPDCQDLSTACESNLVAVASLGPGEARTAWIPAAGPGGAGDYLWSDGRAPFLEAGAWGVVRVRPAAGLLE